MFESCDGHGLTDIVQGFHTVRTEVALSLDQLSHQRAVREHCDRLLHALEVVGGKQHGRGGAMHGDRHAPVVGVDTADHLGQVRLGLRNGVDRRIGGSP